MGQTGSSSTPAPYFPRLNDSVYELYTPDKGEPNLEVLFFHGFQTTDEDRGAYWKTWTSASGDQLWPRDWLAQKFPQSRILSVSYDSSPFTSPTAGRQDLYGIGESLVADIIHLESLGQGRPVVMVGHSVGGLVIKQIILEVYKQTINMRDNMTKRKLCNFINNIKGVFFFSTPHQGSQLSEMANHMPSYRRSLSQLMLQMSSIDSERLNDSFRMWRKSRKDQMKTFSIGETLETQSPNKGLFRRQSSFIVPQESARYDTDGYLAIESDHFTVTQPGCPKDLRFQVLTLFISTVTKVPVSTFEMDSYKIVTGVPVQNPEGFSNRRDQYHPRVLDQVIGIPVKTHERYEGKGPYVRIDVPEDEETFFQTYANNRQNEQLCT